MTDQSLSVTRAGFVDLLRQLWAKLDAYWSLTKSLQTGLLLITGLAGYMSGHPTGATWAGIAALLATLFLTVGGSTVLNMVVDRDIDARMMRTQHRPLPAGRVSPTEGLLLGAIMILAGGTWALAISPLYGIVVLAGAFVDVLVYTCWLKRRTCWSIVWGGIAGGLPALAGRVLATGRIDAVGFWLAASVLLWIPTHIMTFSIKYADDYRAASVPVFPNRYGVRVTRWIIALSTAGAIMTMLWAMYALDLNATLMWIARALGGVLAAFTLATTIHTTPRRTTWLYKLASLYMLGSMIVLIAGA
jgi:protoheme IX farnesyltransferase